MVSPKIVYCDKNHIYDAAIDKYCPYCRKIEEDHRRLSKIVDGSELIYENEEYTELIDYRGQDEEEYTELIDYRGRDEEGYTELIDYRGQDEEGYTELIKNKSGEVIPALQSEEEEDYTELIDSKRSKVIMDPAELQSDEEEYTELIGHKQNDGEADAYSDKEDAETELLVNSGDTCEQDEFKMIKLQGWLVCINGDDLGKSFELSEGDNFVYKEKGSKISVYNIAQENKELMGLLCYQEESGVFVIESHTNTGYKVDGTQIAKECILESYSRIRWEQLEFVFVKFVNNKF